MIKQAQLWNYEQNGGRCVFPKCREQNKFTKSILHALHT
jgi:hypothetical protein